MTRARYLLTAILLCGCASSVTQRLPEGGTDAGADAPSQPDVGDDLATAPPDGSPPGLDADASGIPTDGADAIRASNCPAEATLAAICADPARYDGCEVTLREPVSTLSSGTAAGCECCNALETDYIFRCPYEGTPPRDWDRQGITLQPDESSIWREVHGVVVAPDLTNTNIEFLIGQSRTRLGCAGQHCFEVCTPATPDQVLAARGTFRLMPPTTRRWFISPQDLVLVVHELELAPGATLGGVVCTCCNVHVPLPAGTTEDACASGLCDPYCGRGGDAGADAHNADGS